MMPKRNENGAIMTSKKHEKSKKIHAKNMKFYDDFLEKTMFFIQICILFWAPSSDKNAEKK